MCKHCNTLQHAATHCNTLQHTATCCNILQHTARIDLPIEIRRTETQGRINPDVVAAAPYNALQRTATHCNTLNTLPHNSTHYTTLPQLPHTATHYNALQHATHCNNTLQQHTCRSEIRRAETQGRMNPDVTAATAAVPELIAPRNVRPSPGM